jgi:predicted transcriptional regulator
MPQRQQRRSAREQTKQEGDLSANTDAGTGAERTVGQAAALLGELEAAIMTHCWATATAAGALDGAPQTVADVQQALAAAGRRSAYTTVMTVMGRLVEKGLLRRSASLGRSGPGSSYRYWPGQSERDFLAAASHERVSALIATFGEVALAQFADALSALDPERLAALGALARSTQGQVPNNAPQTVPQTAADEISTPPPDKGHINRPGREGHSS